MLLFTGSLNGLYEDDFQYNIVLEFSTDSVLASHAMSAHSVVSFVVHHLVKLWSFESFNYSPLPPIRLESSPPREI